LIACFLSNIFAKYYESPTMLSRVIAKNIGDVFFETQCRMITCLLPISLLELMCSGSQQSASNQGPDEQTLTVI